MLRLLLLLTCLLSCGTYAVAAEPTAADLTADLIASRAAEFAQAGDAASARMLEQLAAGLRARTVSLADAQQALAVISAMPAVPRGPAPVPVATKPVEPAAKPVVPVVAVPPPAVPPVAAPPAVAPPTATVPKPPVAPAPAPAAVPTPPVPVPAPVAQVPPTPVPAPVAKPVAPVPVPVPVPAPAPVAVTTPVPPAAPVVEHVSLGSKQCQSCHQAIFEHVKESRHWLSFKEFAQGAGAEVAAKMNVAKPTEIGSRCVECHGHTYLNERGKLKTEPISCEACHGNGGDYLAVHNATYDAAKHGADQNAFLAKRRAASVATGMTAQWRLNGGYRNCFTCHVGTDEPIVNTAGHPVMTTFELLAFSQGSVRHWHGTDMTADKPGRLGAIHVAGQAMMLEKSLQAVGTSQTAGPFRTQYFHMAKAAQTRLVALTALAPGIAELKAITAATAALASMTDGNPTQCAAMAKTLAPLVSALNDQLDDKPLADELGAKLIPADMPKP